MGAFFEVGALLIAQEEANSKAFPKFAKWM